jgi:hypothetical protein
MVWVTYSTGPSLYDENEKTIWVEDHEEEEEASNWCDRCDEPLEDDCPKCLVGGYWNE